MSTALDTLQAVTISLTLKATGTKKVAGSLSGVDNTCSTAINNAGSFKLGNTTPGNFNEVYNTVLSVTNGVPYVSALNGTLTDLCNQLSGTLTKILALCLQLLPAADPSTLGTACTSVTLGANGSNQWTAILNSTGTYTMNNGATWFHFDPAGLAVGATDVLKIVNNDVSHVAAVLVTIFGIG